MTEWLTNTDKTVWISERIGGINNSSIGLVILAAVNGTLGGVKNTVMKHRWTECDDLAALYLHKHGTSHIGLSLEDLARKLGIGTGSMKMRIKNFQSADGGRGLPNAAKQSRSVLARFGRLPEPQLRAKVIECLKKGHSAGMIDPNHNPVIGYVLLDDDNHVLCPLGEAFDPVFHSEQRAMEAAAQYGRQADVHKIGKIWLEGTFGVVLYDDGDLMFDGSTAERFVEALRVRGMLPDRKATRRIDPMVAEPKYSCRVLFGDIRYNRNIAANQR